MDNKNILISGAGIAGLTLAHWLRKFGFNPTIIEISPVLREGGYLIDFFGAGYDVAQKMGIIPCIEENDVDLREMTFVDEQNHRQGAMNAEKLKKTLLKNKANNILRSDLAKAIYESLDKNVEYIFNNTIESIQQDAQHVTVSLRDGTIRTFDLLIGADGLHSTVRRLVFGPESRFEKYYGFYASSFTIDDYLHIPHQALIFNIPLKQATLYPLKNNKLGVLFIFTSEQKPAVSYHDIDSQKQILRDQFAGLGWECRKLLDKMNSAPDFYFDSVSQIKMDHWSMGRVSLAGDACDCPSLLSGQGSTLAMVGAYILAGELKEANGNYQTAFTQYENIFKPFMDSKQQLAQSFAGSFVPKSKMGIWMRNTFVNLMFVPFVSEWMVKKFLSDNIVLKDY